MADFDHIKTNVKCTLFKQFCCCYYGSPVQSVGNIWIAGRKALRMLRGLARLTHRDVIALLSHRLSLLVILKQTFFILVNKAMNHISQIIRCVANVAIIL